MNLPDKLKEEFTSRFGPVSTPGEILASNANLVIYATAITLGVVVLSSPAVASQDGGVCSTGLVATLKSLIDAVSKVIPMIAFLFGLVSLGAQSFFSSKDKKAQWKERRNDAFLYGVFGVALAGNIISAFMTAAGVSANSCFDSGWSNVIATVSNEALAVVVQSDALALLPYLA